MSFLRKVLKKALKYDPITSALVKAESAIPGSVGAGVTALTADNVSSNPYKKGEASRHDIFAGGTKLSQKESNRKAGRAIGTAIGLWFAGGAAKGAMSGGGSTGAATSGSTAGGAATTGTAAKSAGIMGSGVTAGEAAAVASTLYATSEQKKASDEANAAMAAQGAAMTESMSRLRRDTPQTPSIDEARRRAEQSDAMRRRRGRRASILTGDTGVGYTPVSQRSLLGT